MHKAMHGECSPPPPLQSPPPGDCHFHVFLHQCGVPQFALKYLCNPPPPRRPSFGDRLPPPPPTGRPSRANVGDCKEGGGYSFL